MQRVTCDEFIETASDLQIEAFLTHQISLFIGIVYARDRSVTGAYPIAKSHYLADVFQRH